jgi:hypothetical protein
VFIYLCGSSLHEDPLARRLLFGFLAFLFLFSCAIYQFHLRHIALGAFLLIALVWIGAAKGSRPTPLFRAWLLVGALCGLATAAVNLAEPFDTADEAASVIRQRKLDTKLWFSFPAYRAIGLAGDTGISFGNLEQDCGFQFMRWNFRTRIHHYPELFASLRAAQARYGSFYFVTDEPRALPSDLAEPVARIRAGYDGQQYNLWKIGKGAASSGKLPACVPGLPDWPGATNG